MIVFIRFFKYFYQFLSDFLNILLKNRSDNSQFLIKNNNSTIETYKPQICNENVFINKTELNILYYIAGYIVANIVKNQNVCEVCVNAVKCSSKMCRFSNITRIKATKQNSFFVNEKTFKFFIHMEKIFRIYYKHVRLQKINLKNFFVTQYEKIDFSLPQCHNMKKKIILRYHAFRLKNASTKLKSNSRVTYASKSAAMHEHIK